MFDMKNVGRKIAEGRKAKNMTQMELADRMGVSFQAVSNWERGQSMPDIAKLPELAALLDLSIDGLLTGAEPARLVREIIEGTEQGYIDQEDIVPETVAQVAPLLKPRKAEGILAQVLDKNKEKLRLEDLLPIAPFVSEEFLLEWVRRAAEDGGMDTKALRGLAPFLSERALDTLVQGGLADFRLGDLVPLAPFLSEKTLDAVARALVAQQSPETLVPLAPFLSAETLRACADELIKKHGLRAIRGIAPFL